jgi:hypothetical protein
MAPVAAVFLVLALPAHAEMFKCKMPDGKIAYQDHACAPEAERKELRLGGIGGTPLANTVGEFVIIHVRRGANYKSRSGRGLAEDVADCIRHRDSSSLAGIINTSIHGELNNDDITETNKFLASPLGQKYAEEAYNAARTGSSDFPHSLPRLTPAEQTQFNAFINTPAGGKTVAGRGLYNIVNNPSVVNAAIRLVRECVDQ